VSYESTTLSASPLSKDGGFYGFSMLFEIYDNSLRMAITKSLTIKTTIPVRVVVFFFGK